MAKSWIWRSVAAVLLVTVLGFWWLQWQSAPVDLVSGTAPAAQARAGGFGDSDGDDD